MKYVSKSELSATVHGAICTTEGTQRGIFFRLPWKEFSFSDWDWDSESSHIAIEKRYQRQIKHPIWRWLHRYILRNGNVMDHLEEWRKNDNFAGYSVHMFVSPIYFKRDYCELIMIGDSMSPITKIHSFGESNEFAMQCAGCATVEKTTVWFDNGRKLKVTAQGSFMYTYEHKIDAFMNAFYQMNPDCDADVKSSIEFLQRVN